VNVAVAPAATDTFTGFVVITGAGTMVSVAAVVVADPAELVKTASKVLPFCPAVAVKLNVVDVAPATAVNAPPVLTIHCTVGVGVPLAAAVNVAVPPTPTDTAVGFVVTTGATVAGAELPQPAINAITVNKETPSIPLARRPEILRSLDLWKKFRKAETINALFMEGLLRVCIEFFLTFTVQIIRAMSA